MYCSKRKMIELISLNKYISNTGICSRREADIWIENGRVRVNGKVAKKGNRVTDEDEINIDGLPLRRKPKTVYIILNKPPGITCTTDLRDRDNIISFINHPQRIFPIGRLDKASSGLIILTNDGHMVNEVLRVENEHEKEYIVTVNRPVTQHFLQRMKSGIPILGVITKHCVVQQKSRFVFSIILKQGLNRQIRRMCEYLDYKVVNLKRVRILNVDLDDLAVGHWRDLTTRELKTLKEILAAKAGDSASGQDHDHSRSDSD